VSKYPPDQLSKYEKQQLSTTPAAVNNTSSCQRHQ